MAVVDSNIRFIDFFVCFFVAMQTFFLFSNTIQNCGRVSFKGTVFNILQQSKHNQKV